MINKSTNRERNALPGFILAQSVVDMVFEAMSRQVGKEILREVIGEAFWASHMKEEDRSVRFSLALKDPSGNQGESFVFDKPIPFDSNALLKLCPALDSRQIIGLSENKFEGKLKIWGFQTKSKRFLWSHDQSGLILQALEPGCLVIRYNGLTICILKGRETVIVHSAPVSNILAEPWTRLYANGKIGARRKKIEALLDIAQQMREIRHGGILIVVPEQSDWADSIREVPYASHSGFDSLKRAYESASSEHIQVKPGEKKWWRLLVPTDRDRLLRQAFQDEVRMVARLSSVDGAILLSPEFRVLGFGAKIKKRNAAQVQNLRVFDLTTEASYDRKIAWLHGTRHQSAAQFAMDQPDSIIFVVSQDGVMSLMTSGPNEGEASVYWHLEYLSVLREG